MEERMGHEHKVLKIEKIEKVEASEAAELTRIEGAKAETSSKTKFDAALAKAEVSYEKVPKKEAVIEVQKGPSPIEELSMSAKKIQRLEPANLTRVVSLAEETRQKLQAPIQKIEETLKKEPTAKLSPIHEIPLSERLVHIDATLKSALGIAGLEAKPMEKVVGPQANPLVKFLNYLTHGDRQLSNVAVEIAKLDTAKGEITPAKLLAIQIKLNFVQQEIEFFTNVLNKGLESVKTLMNIQV